MAWALPLADGRSEWSAGGGDDWHEEVERFFAGLEALDRRLVSSPPSAESIQKLISGTAGRCASRTWGNSPCCEG
jgi:hypothetical protein